MAQYAVKATLTKEYEIVVDAADEAAAIAALDLWEADDFEDRGAVAAKWGFAAKRKCLRGDNGKHLFLQLSEGNVRCFYCNEAE